MSARRLAWLAMPVHMVICGAVLCLDGTFLFSSVADGIGTIVEIAVVAAATTIAALIVGLPLRAISPLRRWWLRHSVLTLIGVGVAVALAALAWCVGNAGTTHIPAFAGSPAYDAYDPDWPTAIAGWLALAFTTAHAWLPTQQLTDLAGPPQLTTSSAQHSRHRRQPVLTPPRPFIPGAQH